jgi:hypothetical protein
LEPESPGRSLAILKLPGGERENEREKEREREKCSQFHPQLSTLVDSGGCELSLLCHQEWLS